jgi:hypothetical protein
MAADVAAARARWQAMFRPAGGLSTAEFDAGKINAWALYSGQGMTNFIQIYEHHDDAAPKATALLDFGQGNSSNGSAVGKVIGFLGEMVANGIPPRIDLAIISHQDKDHWGLINGFLKELALQSWKDQFTIGSVRYGGADWGKSAKAAIDKLAVYSGKAAVPMAFDYSDYSVADGPIGAFETVSGVKFRLLAVNIATSQEKNATSAVVVVDFANTRMVFPGDATYETMEWINERLGKWTVNPIAPAYLVCVPHHGALATFTKYYTVAQPDLSVGALFAKLMAGENVIASAGAFSHHSHPVDLVLNTFIPWAGQSTPHTIVVYVWALQKFFEVTEQPRSLYTLVYQLNPEPAFWDRYFYVIGSPTEGVGAPVERGMVVPVPERFRKRFGTAAIVAPAPVASGSA